MPRLAAAMVIAMALAVPGCASEDATGEGATTIVDTEPVATTGLTSSTTTGAETSIADEDTTTTAPPPSVSEPPTQTVSDETGELTDVLNATTIRLDDVQEPGPHPVLTWQPIDGAESYWLVVTDSDGRPYWAWTGTATSVRIGGGSSGELNQTAAIHEPMSWRVGAFDLAGALVGLSDRGTILP